MVCPQAHAHDAAGHHRQPILRKARQALHAANCHDGYLLQVGEGMEEGAVGGEAPFSIPPNQQKRALMRGRAGAP